MGKPVQLDPLYDEAQVATRYGVSRRTLADWRRRGIGPRFLKLTESKLVRYRGSDLAEWEQQHSRGSTSDSGPRPKRRSPRPAALAPAAEALA